MAGEDAEGSAGILNMHDADESVFRNGLAYRKIGYDSPLAELVGNDYEKCYYYKNDKMTVVELPRFFHS